MARETTARSEERPVQAPSAAGTPGALRLTAIPVVLGAWLGAALRRVRRR